MKHITSSSYIISGLERNRRTVAFLAIMSSPSSQVLSLAQVIPIPPRPPQPHYKLIYHPHNPINMHSYLSCFHTITSPMESLSQRPAKSCPRRPGSENEHRRTLARHYTLADSKPYLSDWTSIPCNSIFREQVLINDLAGHRNGDQRDADVYIPKSSDALYRSPLDMYAGGGSEAVLSCL